jgi:2-C-methyl-D-erythritol 4-phosphate cytidylyltransferase
MKTYAIILAGGSGSRMRSSKAKQLLRLSGKSILRYTVEMFMMSGKIDQVIVVCPTDVSEEYESSLQFSNSQAKLKIVPGGASRNESTLMGLRSIPDSEANVLIHDAVRPFITHSIIDRNLLALSQFDAVDTVIDSADTLVEAHNSTVVSIPDRANFFRGQTPQSFKLSVIKDAYNLWLKDSCPPMTDDCGLILRYRPDISVHCVEGDSSNIKITEPLDLFVAEKLLQMRTVEAPKVTAAPRFPGESVVIFGGESGIGKATSNLLTASGFNVISFSRTKGGPDVLDLEQLERAFGSIENSKNITTVINSAASLTPGSIDSLSAEELKNDVNVNVMGSVLIAKAAFPYLLANSGQLIMFGSSSYTRGRSGYAAYSCSKAAVVNLTQALAEEWAASRVRVNCINPERTRTPLREKAFGEENPAQLLEPDRVANVVADVVMSTMTGMIVDVKVTQ